MKKINILLFIALSLFAFVACDNDGEHLKLNTNDLVTPSFEMNADQDFVVVPTTDQSEIIGTWKWTEASFGVESPIVYSIVADIQESFANEVEVARFSTHSKEEQITIKQLNDAASNLAQESKEVTLYVRLKAFIGTTGNLVPLYSGVKTVSFTCYFYNPKEPLYIIGEGLVGWGNEAGNIGKDLQIFFADHSAKSDLIYTYTGGFKGGKGLKFPTLAGDWDTAYGTNGNALVENGGGDFVTPEGDGIYTLTVDLNALSVKMTPYAGAVTDYNFIGIVGDATPGGWDTDTEMTQVVPHVWVAASVKLTEGKKLKFRVDKDWGTNWGASDADNQELPFGIGAANGADIEITNTGNYYVAFSDLTGHYAIIPESDLPKK